MIDLASLTDSDALPFATDPPPTPVDGEVRARPEDFRVTEIPAYLPSGAGDHLYVHFEKRELTTKDAVRRIADALDVHPRGAGYAGMKDRYAVTEQWASFEHADAARLDTELDGIRILETKKHGNKLRTGHLKGNRFDLLVRGADPAGEAGARLVFDALGERGVPTYFGPQRFGRDGRNLEDAAAWLFRGGRAPRDRFRRKMLASAFQSALFNRLLAARIEEGLLDRALDGDLLQKVESGGLFVCEAPAEDTERALRFEVSATGPMYGPRMRWPEREALAREEAQLAAVGLERDSLRALGKAGPGTRRVYRAPFTEASVEVDPEGLRIRFTLPAGTYATVVLRELLRREVR